MANLFDSTEKESELKHDWQDAIPHDEKTSEYFDSGELRRRSGPIDGSISSSDHNWSEHLYFTGREGQDIGLWVCCALGYLPPNMPNCHRLLLFQDWCILGRATDETIVRTERLRCPMLICRELFDEPTDIMDHIKSCSHLYKATYWCPYCQQRENFNRQPSEGPDIITRKGQRRCTLLKGTYDAVSCFGSEARQRVSSLKSLVFNGKDLLKISKDMRLKNYFTSDKSPAELLDRSQWIESSVDDKLQAYCTTDLPPIIPSLCFDADEDFMELDRSRTNFQVASPLSLANPMENSDLSKSDFKIPCQDYAASTTTLCDEQSTSGDLCRYQGSDYEDRNPTSPVRDIPDFKADGDGLYFWKTTPNSSRREQDLANLSATTLNATLLNEDLLLDECECKSEDALVQELLVVLKKLYNMSFQQLAQYTMEEILLPFVEQLRSVENLVTIAFETLETVFLGHPPHSMLQIYALLHLAHACKLTIDTKELHTLPKYFYEDIVKLGQCIIPEQGDLLIAFTRPLWKDNSTCVNGHFSSMYTRPSESQSHCKDHLDQSDLLKALKESVIVQSCIHFLDILEYSGLSSAKYGSHTQRASRPLEIVPIAILKTDVMEPLRCYVGLETFHPVLSKIECLMNSGEIVNIRQLEVNLIFFGKHTAQHTSPPSRLYREFLEQVFTNCNEAYSKTMKAPSYRYYNYLKDLVKVKEILGSLPPNTDPVSDSPPPYEWVESDCSTVASSLFSATEAASSASSRPTSLDSDMSFSAGIAVSMNTSSQLGLDLDDDTSRSSWRSSAQSESSLSPLTSSFPSPGQSNVIGRGQRNFSRKLPFINTTIASTHRNSITRSRTSDDVSSSSKAALPSPPTSADSISTGSSAEIKSPITKIEVACDQCPKLYTGDSARVNLRRHVKTTHSQSRRRSVCNFQGCQQSFSRPDNRLAHQRKIHQLDTHVHDNNDTL